jgi:hypothetical protein
MHDITCDIVTDAVLKAHAGAPMDFDLVPAN